MEHGTLQWSLILLLVIIGSTAVALHLNRRLWPFTALNSALTQFWCSLDTCGTFAGIDDKSVIWKRPANRIYQN
jgi:hypothetical protein